MPKQYSKKMCGSVRSYFEDFIGYWDRQMQRIEETYPGDDEDTFEKRVRAYNMLLSEISSKARMRGLPTLAKWAKTVPVTASTVSRWRREYPEFDEACRDCLAIQTEILKDGAVGGIYASRAAIFLIKMNEDRAREAEQSSGGMRLEDFDDADDEDSS